MDSFGKGKISSSNSIFVEKNEKEEIEMMKKLNLTGTAKDIQKFFFSKTKA